LGYYARVLTTHADCIPVSDLQAALAEAQHTGLIEVEAGESANWNQIVLRGADGSEVAAIERNPVVPGSLGAEELAEFADEIAHSSPRSSAEWLKEFFAKVQCIYAFQHLFGSHVEAGFAMLCAVRAKVWSTAPAILQADGEGFTNERGYSIDWQFSDSATGLWWMGLLQDGAWVHFQVDLGNTQHRDAFMKGQIPKGVKLAD
jgi:hypothetical protein